MGNRIRELRRTRKMTMKQLGEELGVAESTISQYETGKRQPDNETLLRLGEFFDVTVGYLLGAETEKAPTPEGERKSSDPVFTYAMSGEVDKLTPERKEMLRGMAQYLIDQQAKEEQEKGRK